MIEMMLPDWDELTLWLPTLMAGLRVSLQVAFLSLLLGVPLGFLLALGVSVRSRFIAFLSLLVVEVGRGAPALLLLYFIYYGLPASGLTLNSFMASVVALGWNTGAYTSEIIRASLSSIHHGQGEAAEALGLSKIDKLRFIMVPQALKVALPALLAFAILIFQGTSLCFAIALPELVNRAYGIGADTFRYMPALVIAGSLYALICIPASIIVTFIEKRSQAHI